MVASNGHIASGGGRRSTVVGREKSVATGGVGFGEVSEQERVVTGVVRAGAATAALCVESIAMKWLGGGEKT